MKRYLSLTYEGTVIRSCLHTKFLKWVPSLMLTALHWMCGHEWALKNVSSPPYGPRTTEGVTDMWLVQEANQNSRITKIMHSWTKTFWLIGYIWWINLFINTTRKQCRVHNSPWRSDIYILGLCIAWQSHMG